MSSDLMNLIHGLREQLQFAVADLRQDPKMARILSLHSALNTLEESVSIQKTALADLFDFFKQALAIRPMEFVGMPHLDAAKRFLKIKGEGASFDEIVEALSSGGLDLSKQDQSDLRLSLARSTFEIVKNGEFYGLIEFFPHIKRGRKKRAAGDAAVLKDPLRIETKDADTDTGEVIREESNAE